MRVLFILILVNMDCSDMILCTLTDAGNGFTLKAQHCLLWWKVNEIYSERTVLFTLVCGAAGLYDSYLRASGSAADAGISRWTPWTGWVRLNGPFWPFVREPSEPRIRLRARTELTRMLTRSEGCTTPITFRKVRSSPTPRTGYCASPLGTSETGPAHLPEALLLKGEGGGVRARCVPLTTIIRVAPLPLTANMKTDWRRSFLS